MDNLKNEMKKAGVKLPNRNAKAFIRLGRYNDFFTLRGRFELPFPRRRTGSQGRRVRPYFATSA